MKGFRVAREAPVRHHVAATLLQSSVFWFVFLVALPWLVLELETRLGLPPMALPGHRGLGGALFVAASALGLTTGLWMAVHGRGTPLPLATARDLVCTGPYRVLRNPMALAGIAQGVAVGLWCDSVAVVLYALAGACAWQLLAHGPEERDLAARFAAAHAAYRAVTPLWVPRLGTRRTERAIGAVMAFAALWLLAGAATETLWRRLPFAALLLLPAAQLAASSRPNATSSGQNAAKSASSAS